MARPYSDSLCQSHAKEVCRLQLATTCFQIENASKNGGEKKKKNRTTYKMPFSCTTINDEIVPNDFLSAEVLSTAICCVYVNTKKKKNVNMCIRNSKDVNIVMRFFYVLCHSNILGKKKHSRDACLFYCNYKM